MIWPDSDLKHLEKTQQFWVALTIATWEFVGGRLLWDFHNREVDKLWFGKVLFLMTILNTELDWFWQWIVWHVSLPSKMQDSVVQTIHPRPILSLCLKTWKKPDQPSPVFPKVQMSCCALLDVTYTLHIVIYTHTHMDTYSASLLQK